MKRTILSLMMVLGLIITPASATAAQPETSDTSFVSDLSGEEVDLGTSGTVEFLPDDYSVNEYSSGWEEFIWFTAGWSNFEMILIGGDNTADYYTEITMENMEAFYETFEIVDSDVSETNAFFVANATIEGDPLVVHYQYELDAFGDVDFALLQFSPAESLASDLETVQGEVTVGGEPLLPNIDAQEIASLVTESETSTPTGDTEASPVSGTTDDDNDTSITRGERTDRTEQIDADAEVDSTPEVDEPAASGGDWESMGLVSDTEWVSPGFDTSVTWNGTMWILPLDYEYAIYLEEDPIYEVITLETNDGLGYVFLTIEEQGDTTPTSQADWWNSAEYADTFDAEMTVVETFTTQNTAAVVYETVNTADQPLYVVLTATFMDDGTIIYSQVSAAPDTIHDVYAQFVEGVEVDGAALDLTYTVDDITDISGN